eukprot:1792945-Pyramimonas_sp.AAC.1
MEARWNPNPGCAPQAENGCPGKANKPEGACRNPACRSCSDVCNKCNMQWLCTECYPMDEHSCTYLLIQSIQDQARLAEANTQR